MSEAEGAQRFCFGNNGPGFGAPMLFSCNSNKDLAERIAARLGLRLGKGFATTFSDGEICTFINETVRNRDVYIIQSTSPPVNNNLMELLIMTDAMRRASAQRITAVIPYFGYARQDRKDRSRAPITSKLVANMIVAAGVDRVLTMDLHCQQLQGFFDIPADHLVGSPILEEYYREKFAGSESETVIVSPDVGRLSLARAFANKLNMGLAFVDKRRPKPGETEVMNVIGDISGKRVILTDDMVASGGTLCNDAEALMDQGAKEVFACCTHAILSGNATERIQNSPILELAVLDTVVVPMEKRIPKIKVLQTDETFAESIYRMHMGESLSVMFDRYV